MFEAYGAVCAWTPHDTCQYDNRSPWGEGGGGGAPVSLQETESEFINGTKTRTEKNVTGRKLWRCLFLFC